MGGSLSNRHVAKPPRKNAFSVPKNPPSKISLNKNSPPSSFKTPRPIKPPDPGRPPPPPPPGCTTPIQDSTTSNQDCRIPIAPTSNQLPSTSNQDGDTASKQDPIPSKQDSTTSKQGSSHSNQDPSSSNQDLVPVKSEWKNYTDNELENVLLSKLDEAYNHALSRLVSLGYQKKDALRAILSSGHCQGHFDLMTNILKNSIKYLTYPNEKAVTFSSLRQLEEHSISDLISSLQKLRPEYSRTDSMRHLLAHELHLQEATGMKPVPAMPHGTGLFKPIQSTRNAPPQPVQENGDESEENMYSPSKDSVEEESDEEEIDIEVFHDFVHQYWDLAIQFGEIKEWAQERALQAAKKLSNDLAELRVLHMEKETAERVQKKAEEKMAELEKQLDEVEEKVTKTAEELESVQMEAKKLEMENKEIRAELEAAKLNEADSSKECKRLEKKVKRLDKNCEAAEKQKAVLKDEFFEIKKKRKDVLDELTAVGNSIREFKIKVNEEIRLKEQATRLVETEREATEQAKVNTKKKLQFAINKHALDNKRHSDQVEILNCEIVRLNEAIFSSPSCSLKLCRPCIFCGTAEASMVFLPCRHEVLCSGCGKDYEDIGSEKCPACNVRIEETVYIYGLSPS